MDTSFSTFGQELYLQESIDALDRFHDTQEHGQLRTHLADVLPHKSINTRLRVASKIIQRLFTTPGLEDITPSFVHLVNSMTNENDKCDLIYWRTARTDSIIKVIASEIFYPYFIQHSFPAGYTEESFHIANTRSLFEIDRVITSDFATHYAEKMWNFNSGRTVKLALRIMRQAGILDSILIKIGKSSVYGYYTQPRTMKPETFGYCLCEEFMNESSGIMASLDQVQSSDCVKIFLLNKLQVDSMLKYLERKKLITFISRHGGRYIKFNSPDIDSYVRSII
ncbi:MAG: hypothetical protein ACYC27_00725 [Armatimonadota bacterium]